MFLATVAFIASFTLPTVLGHGYVPIIRVNVKEYKGWDVNSDPYANPPVCYKNIHMPRILTTRGQPLRAVRRTPSDSGFISDPA